MLRMHHQFAHIHRALRRAGADRAHQVAVRIHSLKKRHARLKLADQILKLLAQRRNAEVVQQTRFAL